MSKFGRRVKKAPEGYDYIEGTIDALENELREKVNESHEGLRKNESQWPIHQINWQKSRYVYELYYTYNRISKEVYDYCITNKIVDAALIAKWKKPGYERLCSTYVINPRNYKFGTVSICRVPKENLPAGTEIEDPTTGCRGCASGSNPNIFDNKYGQNLAEIQVTREQRASAKQARLDQMSGRHEQPDSDDEGEEEGEGNSDEKDSKASDSDKEEEEDENAPVGAADGSAGPKKTELWKTNDQPNSKRQRH